MPRPGDYIVGGNVRPDADGNWIINTFLCNNSDKPVRLRVTSYPYDENRNKIGSEPIVKEVTLRAQFCIIVSFGPYPKERKPQQKYTDVYVWTDDERWVWNGWDVEFLASFILPPRENGRTALAFVAPIPFPRRYELAGLGQGTFFIRRVSGLPSGWRVDFLRPALKERFRMAPDTKHWPLVVELSTKRPVKSSLGFQLTVEICMSNKKLRGGRVFDLSYPVAARAASAPAPKGRRFAPTRGKNIPYKQLVKEGVTVPKDG